MNLKECYDKISLWYYYECSISSIFFGVQFPHPSSTEGRCPSRVVLYNIFKCLIFQILFIQKLYFHIPPIFSTTKCCLYKNFIFTSPYIYCHTGSFFCIPINWGAQSLSRCIVYKLRSVNTALADMQIADTGRPTFRQIHFRPTSFRPNIFLQSILSNPKLT